MVLFILINFALVFQLFANEYSVQMWLKGEFNMQIFQLANDGTFLAVHVYPPNDEDCSEEPSASPGVLDLAGDEAGATELWQLRYWPNVAGRAEFIRLILVEAGQEFSELCDPEAIYRDFKCQQKTGWPVFAVPMIKHGNFELGQTATVCRYLAERLNMLPATELDRWRADQTCATVMDFITEGRLAFHGRNFYESYFGQEAATRPYIDYFERHRLPKFLRHFEQVLTFNAANWDADVGKFVVGRSVSYCDLCLLHVLRAAEFQFPSAWADCISDCPRLTEFKLGMETRPRVRDYLNSPRCKPFEGNSMM